jgi:hypothetical protein
LGLKVGEFPEAMQPPFEIDFPFSIAAYRRHFAIELKGSHAAIRALQKKLRS